MSEVQRREHHARMRERFGLRADREWVDWVAEHGVDGGMTLGIPLTEAELAEMNSRTERACTLFDAVEAAALHSAAGGWVEQEAGGLVHLLLARPDEDERAIAEQIVAEHGGVIDIVEHSTRELEQVQALVCEERTRNRDFGRTVSGWGIDVKANAVTLMVRSDLNPRIPVSLQAAVAAGTLNIDYSTKRFALFGSGLATDEEPG